MPRSEIPNYSLVPVKFRANKASNPISFSLDLLPISTLIIRSVFFHSGRRTRSIQRELLSRFHSLPFLSDVTFDERDAYRLGGERKEHASSFSSIRNDWKITIRVIYIFLELEIDFLRLYCSETGAIDETFPRVRESLGGFGRQPMILRVARRRKERTSHLCVC